MEKDKIAVVIAHWFNDSGDVEIVNIAPTDSTQHFDHDLFWFEGKHRPFWKPGTKLSFNEITSTRCYKQRLFHSMNDIPNDCCQPVEVRDEG